MGKEPKETIFHKGYTNGQQVDDNTAEVISHLGNKWNIIHVQKKWQYWRWKRKREKNSIGYGEIITLTHFPGGSVKCAAVRKNVWQFFTKLYIELTHSAIPHVGTQFKELQTGVQQNLVQQCLQQYYWQNPKSRNNPNIHQCVNRAQNVSMSLVSSHKKNTALIHTVRQLNLEKNFAKKKVPDTWFYDLKPTG